MTEKSGNQSGLRRDVTCSGKNTRDQGLADGLLFSLENPTFVVPESPNTVLRREVGCPTMDQKKKTQGGEKRNIPDKVSVYIYIYLYLYAAR